MSFSVFGFVYRYTYRRMTMSIPISFQFTRILDVARHSDMPSLVVGRHGIGKSEFLEDSDSSENSSSDSESSSSSESDSSTSSDSDED